MPYKDYSRNYPKWRYTEVLAKLGSNPDITAIIRAYGFEAPSEMTIQGWRARNSISSTWLPLIVDIALHAGIPFEEFWKSPEAPAKPRKLEDPDYDPFE
jgi:hypothetical protein